jgi:hypothetical protein
MTWTHEHGAEIGYIVYTGRDGSVSGIPLPFRDRPIFLMVGVCIIKFIGWFPFSTCM